MIKYLNWLTSLLIIFFNISYYIPILIKVIGGAIERYMALVLVCGYLSVFSVIGFFSFTRSFMQNASILVLNLGVISHLYLVIVFCRALAGGISPVYKKLLHVQHAGAFLLGSYFI